MELKIDGARNVRDLGGKINNKGEKIKFGRIVRSSHLSYLTDSGAKQLKNYGLKKVIDFRTEDEILNAPDYKMDGVEYLRCPILKELAVGVTPKTPTEDRESTPAERLVDLAVFMGKGAKDWMVNLYVPLVSDEFSLTHYREFFDILKDNKDGCILYHCTSGKDRVGIGTALFLSALGIPREEVIADYMQTNKSIEKRTQDGVNLAKQLGVDKEIIDIIPSIEGVEKEYIEKAFSIIDGSYDNIYDFLYDKLGIDEDYINELKNNYLE
jgi:protein-tyrosine phosphatase